MSNLINNVKKDVEELLKEDKSGHGIDHINRVLNLSLKFSEKEESNKELVSLIALLHDVDDYKIFGIDSSNNLTNTNNILNKYNINDIDKEIIINSIKSIGYSKRLKGIVPNTIEGKIVSDADMCDALGATGILRSYQYNINHNNDFFNKDIFPNLNMSPNEYISKKEGTVINHIFEKLLNLKDLMLTESGKKEAIKRHNFMIDFLYEFFYEEEANDWNNYLDKYLVKKKEK